MRNSPLSANYFGPLDVMEANSFIPTLSFIDYAPDPLFIPPVAAQPVWVWGVFFLAEIYRTLGSKGASGAYRTPYGAGGDYRYG